MKNAISQSFDKIILPLKSEIKLDQNHEAKVKIGLWQWSQSNFTSKIGKIVIYKNGEPELFITF